MTMDYQVISDRLVRSLKPSAAPVAISFHGREDRGLAPRLKLDSPEANEHGRTGQVPAGCVFWNEGQTRTFSTVASDHGNCSVGSYTHGFLSLEDALKKDDIKAVLESGWVDEKSVMGLPRIDENPEYVVYGPLSDRDGAPDVVLLRINGLGLMKMKDAFPEMRIEGKPSCHIIALAKQESAVVASVGCALSRSRTGMRSDEVICAVPGNRLLDVVEKVEAAVELDLNMAGYASADAKRFSL